MMHFNLLNFPFLASLSLLAVFSCRHNTEPASPAPSGPTGYSWNKPEHFPEPVYDFKNNPLTEEGVRLGNYLFYDGVFSRTNIFGCGTCHQQQVAFTHHGHDLSHGVDDLLSTRNAPSLQNLAWGNSFFWDGKTHTLDAVAVNPIENPVELNETVPSILHKLSLRGREGAKIKLDYPKLFKEAFGSEEITSERMMKALSQFMLTLVSATSKYDFYLKGDLAAFNSQEKEGMLLFQKNCSSCHAGVLMTDHSYRNNGLLPSGINDLGRYIITGKEGDRYSFKVPSLRNVGVTWPYMHDGRFDTLEEVLDHYSDGLEGLSETSPKVYKTLDKQLIQRGSKRVGIPLSTQEKKAIIAFLHTLTDEIFLKDMRLSDPGIGNQL